MSLSIREATINDMPQLIDLVLRLKRLNAEFDPLLKTVPDDELRKVAEEYLRTAIEDKSRYLVLVAETNGRIVGVLKADVRDRLFYIPRKEGYIIEFYIMPEYRRKALGKNMIDEAAKRLKERGAGVILAEFPALNQIAVNFYTKAGFRPILYIYARESETTS